MLGRLWPVFGLKTTLGFGEVVILLYNCRLFSFKESNFCPIVQVFSPGFSSTLCVCVRAGACLYVLKQKARDVCLLRLLKGELNVFGKQD